LIIIKKSSKSRNTFRLVWTQLANLSSLNGNMPRKRVDDKNRSGMKTLIHLLLGLALAALSALLLTLAFPPYNLCLFIWLGFIPMLVAQYRLMPQKLSSLAPAVAIGGWLGGYLIPIFGGTGSYMAWLPPVIGLIILLMDKNKCNFHVRSGFRWFVLEGAVGWVGMEMLRSFIPSMGTWAFTAYALFDQAWLIQPVSIFSIYSLSLLIMLVNNALALGALALFDGNLWRNARCWLLIAAFAWIGWTSLSLALYHIPNLPTVRVAAIQVPGRSANNRSFEKGPQHRLERFRQLLDQTRDAARQGAQIIVWPEGALDFDPQVGQTAELESLAQETQAYLVIGYMVTLLDGSWRNEATVLGPTGEFMGVFGKDHPVVFSSERNTSLDIYPVYETTVGNLGTIICYDLDFTDTARKVTLNGAQIIAVPSLDWPPIASKHYTHLVFRAIENRVSMVKSDGGYDSAIIDSYGRIIQKTITPESANATLVADIPLGTRNTLVTRFGDWVGWLCLMGMAFFMVFMPTTMQRRME
jgi:apolipoprotein N-acyltransferase